MISWLGLICVGLVCLLGCSGTSRPAEPVAELAGPTESDALSGARATGEDLFYANCATCHLGGGGLLGSPRTPDLFDDPLPRGETNATLLHSIEHGIDAPRMPAFETGLSPTEMQSISDYILTRRREAAAIRSGR